MVRFGTLLVAIVATIASFGAVTGLSSPTAGASAPPPTVATDDVPADDVPAAPSGTVSEFYPESANLSDCVGLVEKPGCGSDSRGGWHQSLVFIALFAGLAVILWRVSRGISANRRTIDEYVDTGRSVADGSGSESEPTHS